MTRKATLTAVVVAALVATSVAAVGAVATTGSTPAATDSTVALQDNETNETMGNDTMGENVTANVTFEDQTSNGSAVVVNNTSLPEGGFVVIHVVENETFGAVIGNSSYLEPGEYENLTITLDPPIEEGQPLIAMPHRDTNDNQTYEFPEADDPYVANGTPITGQAFVAVDTGNATMDNETANATDT